MSETIIVAIISLVGIIISNMVSMKKSADDRKDFAKELYNELDKRSELSDANIRRELAVMMEQIGAVRGELSRHTAILERVGKLEQTVAVHSADISSLRTHLNDLERVVNKNPK